MVTFISGGGGAEGPTGASPPLTEGLTRCPGSVSMWNCSKSWSPLGGLEQMTDRDTDDLDAASQSCDGKHTAFWDQPLGWHPLPKASGEPSPGPFCEALGAESSSCLSTSPWESSSDTQLIILWTVPISHWAHPVLNGVRRPGTHSDWVLTCLSACRSEPTSVQGSASAPTLWCLVSITGAAPDIGYRSPSDLQGVTLRHSDNREFICTWLWLRR